MAGNLQLAYNLIVQACNDPNIGYYAAWPQRTTITLGSSSITYCDCSSLISWALTGAGFFNVNPWFATGTERQCLLSAGFTELPNTSVLQVGDILWSDGYNDHYHTEMVYEAYGTNCISMGAHGREGSYATDFPRQVSINSYMTSGSSYQAIFRYGQGVVPLTWAQGDGTFSGTITDTEKYQNAIIIAYFLFSLGATTEAVAGVLGNLDHESGLDPNIWYGGIVGSVAYGLPQFNPASGYRNYAQSQGIDLNDADANGNFQMRCISENLMGGWLPTSSYPYSWEQFLQITDVQLAVDAFYNEFERGGPEQYGDRDVLARYWYAEIPNFPANIGSNIPRAFPYLPGIICDLKRRKRLL